MLKDDWRRTVRGYTMTTDPQNGVILDQEDNVQRAGYRSTADMIYELTRSGAQLQMAREEKYIQPTGLTPRHYGEIDVTVAIEKTIDIRNKLTERAEKAKKDEEERQKAAKEAEELKFKKAVEEAAKSVQGTPT